MSANQMRAGILRCIFAALIVAVTPDALASLAITWTEPADGSVYNPPYNGSPSIQLSTSTSVGQGYTLSKVEFFYGTTLIATANNPNPNGQFVVWTNVPAGTYSIYAKATAVKNHATPQTAITSPVTIVVNAPPVITLTSPADLETQLTFPLPTVTLTAEASDSDGSIAAVEFRSMDCNGTQNIFATVTTPPYTYVWTIPTPYYYSDDRPECYSIDATAIDNHGARTTTLWKYIQLVYEARLTSPSPGATFTAPAAIPLSASISAPDYPIARVEFYNGQTLIGESSAAPFSFNWQNVPAGNYSVTAKMISITGDVEFVSTAVNVTVSAGQATLYVIEVDHLDTPRLVVDAAGTTVWRWDQQEPFGDNVADENPSGLRAFDLPLRLPGQRYDEETGLHYNYYRDLDPSIGRYAESDPIGLRGGINTYAYALSSPLTETDAAGLAVNVYCRPAVVSNSGFFHCFVQVTCPSEGWSKTFSLFANWRLRGQKRMNSPDDDTRKGIFVGAAKPKACMADECGYEKIIANRYESFPSGTVQYGFPAPNSNSFVNGLLGGNLPSGAPSPDLAPGIDVPHPAFPQR